MGQYHVVACHDRGEFLDPGAVGVGRKLGEIAGSLGSPATSLLALLATGLPAGLFDDPDRTLGAWAGCEVAFVGDYAEDSYLPARWHAGTLYSRRHEDMVEVTPPLAPLLEQVCGLRAEPLDVKPRALDTRLTEWGTRAPTWTCRLLPFPADDPVTDPGPELVIVNLTAGEFFDPAAFGIPRDLPSMMRCWSQGPAAALVSLTSCATGRRGKARGHMFDGRWAGDRLALVTADTCASDLPETCPLPAGLDASQLWDACFDGRLSDVSELVASAVFEHDRMPYMRIGGRVVRSQWYLSREAEDWAELPQPAGHVDASRAPVDVSELRAALAAPADRDHLLRLLGLLDGDDDWLVPAELIGPLRAEVLADPGVPADVLASAVTTWPLDDHCFAALMSHPSLADPSVADDLRMVLLTRPLFEVSDGVLARDPFVAVGWALRSARLTYDRPLLRLIANEGPELAATVVGLASGWSGSCDELVDAARRILAAPAAG